MLARVGGLGVRELLLQQLRSAPRSVIYWEAAKGLGLLGDTRAIGALGRMVNGPSTPWRRAAAAYALGMMSGRVATKPLLRAIQVPGTPALVRSYVVEALGVLEATVARDVISALVEKDRSPCVRGAAAYAPGRIGNRHTLKVLKRVADRESARAPYLGPISAIARASMRQIHGNMKRRRARSPRLAGRGSARAGVHMARRQTPAE